MIFVDTGAFVARYVRHDSEHRRAKRSWAEIERTGSRCFTSNFVLDETFTLLGRRASYAFAAERARALLGSKALTVLRPDPDDEMRAVELFAKLADQRVSFTDCVPSFSCAGRGWSGPSASTVISSWPDSSSSLRPEWKRAAPARFPRHPGRFRRGAFPETLESAA